MTKAELEAQLIEAKAALLIAVKNSNRYKWLRESATQMNLDELAEKDEKEWDRYIDGAMNRR